VKKLKTRRGETLVEALASILVAALSVALLFGGIAAAAGMDSGAREWDEAYYRALSAAEEQAAPAPLSPSPRLRIATDTAGILPQELEIALYGQKGAWSYAAADGEAGP